MNRILLAFALFIQLWIIVPINIVHAGEFQYECEIRQIFDISNGKTEIRRSDIAVGQKITISRQTGDIVGSPAYVLNRGQGWKDFMVLDRGSSEQSYKFLAVSSGPYRWVISAMVKEYESGPTKTFLHLDNFVLTTGQCR